MVLYRYDDLNRALTEDYTGQTGIEVAYGYNAVGQLETVQRKEPGDSDFTNAVTNFSYVPHGKVTYQSHVNNVATTNTYDAARLYRLTAKVTKATIVQQQAQSAQSGERIAAMAGPIEATKPLGIS